MPFGPKEMPISTTPTSSIQPCGRDGRRLQQPRTGWGLQKDGKMFKLDFFRSIGKSTTEGAVVSYSSVAWVRRKLSGFPILLSLRIQEQSGKFLLPFGIRRSGVFRSDLDSSSTFHQPGQLGFRLWCPDPLWSHLQVQESPCSHHNRCNR